MGKLSDFSDSSRGRHPCAGNQTELKSNQAEVSTLNAALVYDLFCSCASPLVLEGQGPLDLIS